MQTFTDLRVWQLGHAFVLALYQITDGFPSDERFGLVSQIRRAAVSIPTNIAEGSKRRGNQDYARFLNVAESSPAETQYLLILSRDLGYLEPTRAEPLLANAADMARMLHALRVKVEQGDAAE